MVSGDELKWRWKKEVLVAVGGEREEEGGEVLVVMVAVMAVRAEWCGRWWVV